MLWAMNNYKLIEKLEKEHALSLKEYEELIGGCSEELADFVAQKADKIRRAIYGNRI